MAFFERTKRPRETTGLPGAARFASSAWWRKRQRLRSPVEESGRSPPCPAGPIVPCPTGGPCWPVSLPVPGPADPCATPQHAILVLPCPRELALVSRTLSRAFLDQAHQTRSFMEALGFAAPFLRVDLAVEDLIAGAPDERVAGLLCIAARGATISVRDPKALHRILAEFPDSLVPKTGSDCRDRSTTKARTETDAETRHSWSVAEPDDPACSTPVLRVHSQTPGALDRVLSLHFQRPDHLALAIQMLGARSGRPAVSLPLMHFARGHRCLGLPCQVLWHVEPLQPDSGHPASLETAVSSPLVCSGNGSARHQVVRAFAFATPRPRLLAEGRLCVDKHELCVYVVGHDLPWRHRVCTEQTVYVYRGPQSQDVGNRHRGPMRLSVDTGHGNLASGLGMGTQGPTSLGLGKHLRLLVPKGSEARSLDQLRRWLWDACDRRPECRTLNPDAPLASRRVAGPAWSVSAMPRTPVYRAPPPPDGRHPSVPLAPLVPYVTGQVLRVCLFIKLILLVYFTGPPSRAHHTPPR